MVSNSFRLSRQQIAKIVGNDPEAIKQFEKLFSVNQEYFQSGEVDSTIIEAGSAGATATQALGETALLDDRVQALELVPPTYPHVKRYDYGSFYSNVDQTAALANTAYAVTFNNTRLADGIRVASSSRLTVSRGNVYRVGYTLQAINSGGANHRIYSWLKVNGTTDVAASTSVTVVGSGSSENFIAAEFLVHLNANDYVELMWEVSDTAVSLHHDAATGVHPEISSANVVITNNISAEGAV